VEKHAKDVAQFLDRLYDPALRKHQCDARSISEFSVWKNAAAPAFSDLLGLAEIARTSAGHIPVVEINKDDVRMDGFVQKSGSIETEPGVCINFHLLIPDGNGPFPLAITPHGHESGDTYVGIWSNEIERVRVETQDQDVAVQAAKRGFLTIAPATRGIGKNPMSFRISDIAARHSGNDCVCHNWQVTSAGRTTLGERAWDLMRIIDWAITRPDVDGDRILMLGNSGGGMATAHTAACDDRISVAVPCCAYNNYMSFEGTLRHCPCNAIPGIFRFGEFWDVAGLIAPRPLLTVNGLTDSLHPVSEVNAAVSRLREIYTASGAPERYEHRYGDGGHRFYSDLMWPWIEAHIDCRQSS
jgi:hypothetical protein